MTEDLGLGVKVDLGTEQLRSSVPTPCRRVEQLITDNPGTLPLCKAFARTWRVAAWAQSLAEIFLVASTCDYTGQLWLSRKLLASPRSEDMCGFVWRYQWGFSKGREPLLKGTL